MPRVLLPDLEVLVPPMRTRRAVAPPRRLAGARRHRIAAGETGQDRESVQDLSAMAMQSAPDAMYVLGPDRRIKAWNTQAQALTGYPAQDVLDRVCSSTLLNHVDDQGHSLCGTRCPLRLTMLDGLPRQATVFVHHRDGHLVPIDVRSAVMQTREGVVVGAVEVFRDATATLEQEHRIRRLETLASRDPLTGVGNRRAMGRLLSAYLKERQEHGTPFAAMLVDLDQFKKVNDRYGHATGDRVLRAVATTLQAGTRGHVMRYGGEEFLVLAPVPDATEALRLADTLRRLVAAVHVRAEHAPVTVTASLGVTLAKSDDTADGLVARADHGLLAAKDLGRNRALLAEA